MKKNYIVLSAISATTFLLGMFLYAFFTGIIIFRTSSHKAQEEKVYKQHKVQKKTVTFHYWHHNTWKQESVESIWSASKNENLIRLISSWLTFLDEEGFMQKKVTLQNVLLSANQNEAYVSFDRTPFAKQADTFTKWMWIEALLKTIRENNIALQNIYFLVHHQPLNDTHLDFSNAWPVNGFIK